MTVRTDSDNKQKLYLENLDKQIIGNGVELSSISEDDIVTDDDVVTDNDLYTDDENEDTINTPPVIDLSKI